MGKRTFLSGHRNRYRGAMSLIELMVAVVVILVAVLALWRVYAASVQFTITAQELNIIADDISDVMEKIRNTAFTDTVTTFPDGAAIDANIIGGYGLDAAGPAGRETITVSYDDVNDDPLEITVSVQWTGRDGHTYSGSEWDFETLKSSGL